MTDKLSSDPSVEEDDAADETEIEIENDEDGEDDEDRPRRQRRRRKRKNRREPAFDPVADLQRRGPFVFARERFQAWLKQHYPAIRDFSGLTVEILAEYDDYDMAMVRQAVRERAFHPAAPADPKVAEFAATAFSHGDECGWATAFRDWAAHQHRIHHSKQVTRAIMDEWWKYELAQKQAHHAKADFEHKELEPEEYQAGGDQWLQEKHRYFDGFPNTRATWAALMQRRADRIALEALRKAEEEWQEAAERAERQRLETRVQKLQAYKLPAIQAPVPKLAAIGGAREEHDKAKTDLLQTWRARFTELPSAVQTAWQAYHHLDLGDEFDGVYLTPRDGADIDDQNADKVVVGLHDAAFAEFRAFNEGVRRAIKAIDDKLEHLLNPPADAFVPHRGYTLEEIKDEDEHYVLADVIPEGLSVLYGAPKVGKSSWAQKLSACVASDDARFDGAEVAHGRVLYISCDTGARNGAVKRRLNEILTRLELATNTNLVVVDDPVILNDPASVASLLEQNPGSFTLVVIDPLYQCASGSLVQDGVMMEVIKGLSAIQRTTGAAVLLIHHEPRNSQHLFGSMLLDAALDAQIHVERDENTVTVKVELLKNGEAPTRPLVYEFEGAYLAPATATAAGGKGGAVKAPTTESRYSEILTLLTDTPIRETEARKRVEHLLPGRIRIRAVSNGIAPLKPWRKPV